MSAMRKIIIATVTSVAIVAVWVQSQIQLSREAGATGAGEAIGAVVGTGVVAAGDEDGAQLVLEFATGLALGAAPYYGAYAYAPYPADCYIQRRWVVNAYGYRVLRNVRVCY